MYRCEKCSKISLPKRPEQHSFITEPVTYPYRSKVNKTWDGKVKDDKGGRGTQIVQQIKVCPSCYLDEKEAVSVSS